MPLPDANKHVHKFRSILAIDFLKALHSILGCLLHDDVHLDIAKKSLIRVGDQDKRRGEGLANRDDRVFVVRLGEYFEDE